MTGGELRRRLGFADAVALFVGIILGSGVFVAPAAVAAAVPGTPLGAAFLWVLGGIVASCGALCYAECGTRLPRTGGFYAFYRVAFGDALAFVGGWAALFVTYPASLAAIALIFAEYLVELLPAAADHSVAVAAAAVVSAAALNAVGIRTGAVAQRLLTAMKVLSLAALCAAAILTAADTEDGVVATVAEPASFEWAPLLTAFVVLLWTYDGWSDVTLVSGEIRDPARNLGRAVVLGAVILVVLYVSVQASVGVLLPAERASSSSRVVAEAVEEGLGRGASRLVAALVLVSTFGAIHGIVFTASRLGYAMARDGAFVRWFGEIHPRRETPARSIGALTAAAVFYVLVAGFRNLLQYFSFNVWIFYGTTAVALLVLRHRGVGGGSVWKAPGGVLAPAVVLLTAVGMTSGLFAQNPRGSAYGLVMLAAGFVLYAAWRSLRAARGTRAP